MSSYIPEDELVLLYRKTITPLYAYVSKRVGGDRSLAEDLVQETWMKALDAWPRKGAPDEPLAWLLRVARNTMVSHFRRLRPQLVDPTTIDLADDRFSPDTPDAASLVSWGLAHLRRGHAELLEDFYFEGRTVAEIAAARRMSERAVEGRLRRARVKLKTKIERGLKRAPAGVRKVTGEERDAEQTRTR